jgi:hypothetical protein
VQVIDNMSQSQTGQTRHSSIEEHMKEVKARTVKIDLPRSGSYIRPEIAEALGRIIKLKDIVALGPARWNHQWQVTFSSKAAADRLLQEGQIQVRDACAGRLTSMDPARIKMRLHWAPFWLPVQLLKQELQRTLPEGAFLEGIGVERSTITGLEHVATLTRNPDQEEVQEGD